MGVIFNNAKKVSGQLRKKQNESERRLPIKYSTFDTPNQSSQPTDVSGIVLDSDRSRDRHRKIKRTVKAGNFKLWYCPAFVVSETIYQPPSRCLTVAFKSGEKHLTSSCINEKVAGREKEDKRSKIMFRSHCCCRIRRLQMWCLRRLLFNS